MYKCFIYFNMSSFSYKCLSFSTLINLSRIYEPQLSTVMKAVMLTLWLGVLIHWIHGIWSVCAYVYSLTSFLWRIIPERDNPCWFNSTSYIFSFCNVYLLIRQIYKCLFPYTQRKLKSQKRKENLKVN